MNHQWQKWKCHVILAILTSNLQLVEIMARIVQTLNTSYPSNSIHEATENPTDVECEDPLTIWLVYIYLDQLGKMQ